MADLGLYPVLPGAVCHVDGKLLSGSLSPAKSIDDADSTSMCTEVGGEAFDTQNDSSFSSVRDDSETDLEAGQALGELAATTAKVDCQTPAWGGSSETMCSKSDARWSQAVTGGSTSSEYFAPRSAGTFLDSFSLKVLDKEILRAARLSNVMARNASVMKSGTKADWQTDWDWDKVSEPVTELDAFLSHNWSAPRVTKFLQLALHFHWWPAVISLLPAVLVGVALNFTRMLPVLEFDYQLPICIGCQVMGTPTFLIVLTSWSQILGCFGRHKWSAKVFLDKYCVHQEDEDKKRRGIGLLPVWILQSREILVLANKEYFSRLWTVYEMASFLVAKERQRVHIMPAFLPMVVLVAMLLYGSLGFVFHVLTSDAALKGFANTGVGDLINLWPYLAGVFTLMGIPFLYNVLIHWATEDRDTQDKLRTFRIQDSQCSCEDDRNIVYHNVASFEVACGFVGKSATQEQALDSFNGRVQTTVPEVLAQKGGRIGIPYRYLAMVFLANSFKAVDKVCAFIMQPDSPRTLLVEVLKCLADNFIVGPALAVLLILVAKKAVCFHANFWKQRVFSIMGVLAVIVMFYVQAWVLRILTQEAGVSNINLILLVIGITLVGLPLCAFRRTHSDEDTEAIGRLKMVVDSIAKKNQTVLTLDADAIVKIRSWQSRA